MATTTDGSKTSRKGPTRSEESKAAILEATRVEMAETGWRGFSVDSVAKRASASKQTIYRWWPSIGAMCVDAALALIPDSPDGGRDPQERITALIVPLEATARTGQGHAVLRVALLAAVDDKEAGEVWRAWIGRDIRQPLRMLLAELAGKKVIRRDFDQTPPEEWDLRPQPDEDSPDPDLELFWYTIRGARRITLNQLQRIYFLFFFSAFNFFFSFGLS